MILPYFSYQVYRSLFKLDDCTPPKCGALSEYTDSAHSGVEDLSYGLNV